MKKWRKRLRIGLAAVTGLVLLLVWDGRMIAMLRFAGQAHVPSLGSDFSHLDSMLPGPDASIVEMYAGLPHPYHGKREFVRDLWMRGNRSIHGYRFYKQPEHPAAAAGAALVDILSKRESFRAYRGPKMCGGYHADFAVRLEAGGKSTWFLVCLGCSEVLMYGEHGELICDLEEGVGRKLQETWLDCRGVPFVEFQSRLPVDVAVFAESGFIPIQGWVDNSIHEGEPDSGGNAFVRNHVLVARESGNGKRVKLIEETYTSTESAERRAKQLFGEPERAVGRVKAGFVLGKHVYWIDASAGESGTGARELLNRLKDHFQEKSLHTIRQYEEEP